MLNGRAIPGLVALAALVLAGVSGWDVLSEISPEADTGLVMVPDELLPAEIPEPSVPKAHGTAAAVG